MKFISKEATSEAAIFETNIIWQTDIWVHVSVLLKTPYQLKDWLILAVLVTVDN